MKYEITLNDGTEISLANLNQQFTYQGLLEGVPTSRMNEGIRNESKKYANELFDTQNTILIEPKETPIEIGRKYPFGEPSKIPPIRCVANFKCLQPVSDDCCGYSYLPIIWFQDEFALPLSEEILTKIKSISWKKSADDWEY